MIDEWTNGKVNYFEVESADPGSPTYGYLNPNDGRFYCYGIGPWKYAMEVPCGPNVTSVHSGTIRERRFKILSTYNCLDVMNDMILNSMDADGTIFSKTVVNDDGYFGVQAPFKPFFVYRPEFESRHLACLSALKNFLQKFLLQPNDLNALD